MPKQSNWKHAKLDELNNRFMNAENDEKEVPWIL